MIAIPRLKMKRISKRIKECRKMIDKEKHYSLQEATALLQNLPHAKFDETIEIAFKLNINPKQSEQTVRGATVLPHGIGKKVKVCAFCKGQDINKAKEAGADFVGSSDLIEKIKKGWLEFDKTCSTPELMKEVAQLGKVLGPRGMMPSPKSGTVGQDIEHIINDLKSGKAQFKSDKTGNINAAVGKISFSAQNIHENALALLKAIIGARPASIKGRFIENVSISTTMAPAVKLDVAKLG